MVKHNNVVASGNVKKDWQRHVKTWFNQPARKQRRRIGEQPRSCLFFFRLAGILAASFVRSICDVKLIVMFVMITDAIGGVTE
jgi:hypothetical protein